MKNLNTLNEARHIAEKLLNQAKENEPKITADLQNIASEISAEIVGLENKFKSEASLIRKLIDLTEADSAEISQIVEKFNDALRYTFVVPFEIYTESFRQTLRKLQKTGYQVPENKIWNARKNIETKFDRGYRGINITIISSQGQKFELQFHTAESFEFKTENHHFYKESKNRETSRERKREIAKFLAKTAEKIAVPEGVR
jgi:predicted secreted protein